MEWVGLTTCGVSLNPKWSHTKAINRGDLRIICTHSFMRSSSWYLGICPYFCILAGTGTLGEARTKDRDHRQGLAFDLGILSHNCGKAMMR